MMTAQLAMDALLMAIFRRGRPQAVLHHSDQGSQYTSEDFQRLLESHGIVCSMSQRGNCWDSAAMESFFSTPKTERLENFFKSNAPAFRGICGKILEGASITP
jgi:putative transposase